MKAMTLLNGAFALEDVAEPVPAAGQLLVRPLACGVCGSDLHARDHADHLCAMLKEIYNFFGILSRIVRVHVP